jgi:hypothetical protein
MAEKDPFHDPPHHAHFSVSPRPSYAHLPSSPYQQPSTGSYPPRPYPPSGYDDGDVGHARNQGGLGGVDINGQHMPWVSGEEDDELKPLNGGYVDCLDAPALSLPRVSHTDEALTQTNVVYSLSE